MPPPGGRVILGNVPSNHARFCADPLCRTQYGPAFRVLTNVWTPPSAEDIAASGAGPSAETVA